MEPNIEAAAKFIMPLNINGLEGRMLYLPSKKRGPQREILILYGHHSTLERWWGFAQCFGRHGTVTMPDLPGFGGMESLYQIGKKPDLDAMADYMASFVKWRYKRKRFTIIGLSFGFLVATRMLQRYPELAKKVDILVSAVGFSHYDDFIFTKTRRRLYIAGSKLITIRPLPTIFRYTALDPWVLRKAYAKTFNAKKKFAGVDPEISRRMMDMEIVLWHENDVRTHMYTTVEMLTVDNCKQQVNLPVWHVGAGVDQYFDANIVEQHMRVIFSDYHETRNSTDRHAPSVIADETEASDFVPKSLIRELTKHAK
ncbi:alpha/beta hydrolase [Aeromicrobium sp.]|nr:alpha/beta hydrolase [Candidatus Saccharibacteria bacterium]